MVKAELDDRITLGYSIYKTVQCFPMETIALGLNITNVTVFSLDVEGKAVYHLSKGVILPWQKKEVVNI